MMSDYQIKRMVQTARKKERETGLSLDQILINIAHGEYESTVKDRLAAINIYKGFVMTKSSEQNINVKRDVGPAIGLPPTRQDPALKVVKG